VLAEHLHDTPIRRQFAAILIFREVLSNPEFLGGLIDRL
jgi:hypothetical protein